MRTIWQTKTFRGASIAGAAGIIILIGGNLTNVAKRHFPSNAADIEDISAIIMNIAGLLAVGGSGAAVLGRAAARDTVSSPGWMPGPNEGDSTYTHK